MYRLRKLIEECALKCTMIVATNWMWNPIVDWEDQFQIIINHQLLLLFISLFLSLSSQSEVIIEIICLVRSLYVMDFFFHRLNFVDFSSPLMRDRSENTVFLLSLFLCSFHNSLWKIVISSDMYQNLLHWTAISNSHTNHTKNCGRDREKDKLRRWKCEDGYEEDKKKIKRKTEVRIGWLLI